MKPHRFESGNELIEVLIDMERELLEVRDCRVLHGRADAVHHDVPYLLRLREQGIEPQRHHMKLNFFWSDAIRYLLDGDFRSPDEAWVVIEGEYQDFLHGVRLVSGRSIWAYANLIWFANASPSPRDLRAFMRAARGASFLPCSGKDAYT